MNGPNMASAEIKSLEDIRVGMRFIMPACEDRGVKIPQGDWLIVARDDLGTDEKGIPIVNRWQNKFLAKTDDMEKPILFCFDDVEAISRCGVRFYKP